MTGMRGLCLCLLQLLFAGPSVSAPPTRTGGDVMHQFEQGLAEPGCADASRRWRMHYAQAAKNLADEDDVALMVFAYVLDEVRKAGLPSELALIPFVETHFQADVRSTSGPAGLWQFTASTARHHGIRVHTGLARRQSQHPGARAGSCSRWSARASQGKLEHSLERFGAAHPQERPWDSYRASAH